MACPWVDNDNWHVPPPKEPKGKKITVEPKGNKKSSVEQKGKWSYEEYKSKWSFQEQKGKRSFEESMGKKIVQEHKGKAYEMPKGQGNYHNKKMKTQNNGAHTSSGYGSYSYNRQASDIKYFY